MTNEFKEIEYGALASSSAINNNFNYLISLCSSLSESISSLNISTQTIVQNSFKTLFGSFNTSDFSEITGPNKTLLEWLKESKNNIDVSTKALLTKELGSKVIITKSPIPKDTDGTELTDEQLNSLFSGTTPKYNGIYRNSTTNDVTISNKEYNPIYYHYVIKEYFIAGSEKVKDDGSTEIINPQPVFREIFGRIPSGFLYYNGKSILKNFIINLPEVFYKDISTVYEPIVKIVATSTTNTKTELTPTLTRDFTNKTLTGSATFAKNYPKFDIVFSLKGGIL